MSQGLGKLTGLQDKFDFAGVAAAGIGSAAGDFVGARVGGSKLGNYAASSAASAIANAATRSAINGENFGRNLVAAIPDLIAGILQRAIGSAADGVKTVRNGSVYEDQTTVGEEVEALLKYEGDNNEIAEPGKVADISENPPTGAQDEGEAQAATNRRDRAYIDQLDREEVSRTGAYAAPNPDADETQELAENDQGKRLGPNDTFGRTEIPLDGDVIESRLPRNVRIDRVISLLADGKYAALIDENFAFRSTGSISDETYIQDRATIREGLTELLTTNTGRRLLIAIAHKGIDVTVNVNRTNENSGGLNSGQISIDVRSLASINANWKNNGQTIPWRLSVIIGHELGHSVLGYKDNVTNISSAVLARKLSGGTFRNPNGTKAGLLAQGDNVRYVENPLRRELGLTARTSYNSPDTVRRFFPELFK